MRKLFAFIIGFLVVVLAGCGNQADLIKHQADANVNMTKWRAKADIEKWKAVNTLAGSQSDVGRATAAMAIQADNIKSGGGNSSPALGYQLEENPIQSLLSISREARGWLGLKWGHDENMSQIDNSYKIQVDNNLTSLGTSQIISNTGVAGINATTGLGQSAIQKIPSQ